MRNCPRCDSDDFDVEVDGYEVLGASCGTEGCICSGEGGHQELTDTEYDELCKHVQADLIDRAESLRDMVEDR